MGKLPFFVVKHPARLAPVVIKCNKLAYTPPLMNDLYHKYLVTIVHQVAFTNLAILNYLSQKSSNHRSLTFAFESFLVIFIVQSQFLVANPAFSHIQHANRAHGADEGMKGLSDNDVDFTQKNRDF